MSFDKKNIRKALLLYAVTDRAWLCGARLADQVERAVHGGATFVQLREKNLDREEFRREALEVKTVCARYGVPFVIDDDVELALAVDADGVHVGQSDMEAGNVRRRVGPDKIVGVTARTVEQALCAQARGADYLGCGAVFPTGTKSDAKALNHEDFQRICEAADIPVVAIGGITGANMEELRGRKMSGFAVVSAIFAQPDIEAAAHRLRQKAEDLVDRGPKQAPVR